MKDDTWLMVLHSEDWIEMLKQSLRPENTHVSIEKPNNDRSINYATQNAVRALKGLLKELDKEQ